MRMDGKVAIVTGGCKGIGRGIAAAFATEGAAVVVADIDEATGKGLAGDAVASEAAKAEERRDGHIVYHRTNVAVSGQVEELIDFTLRRYGRLDVLVNNAGYHISKDVENTSEEEWDYLLQTNLKSTFLCSKYAMPALHRTRGNIVNISSMVGLVGQANAGAYAASKGGQIALTKGMALDLAKAGVRVNAICPGWVETPLVEDWFSQQPVPQTARDHIYSIHPLGRIASIEEIARAALFLATEEASFITGIALQVDGGVTLGY